jgi:hypothetical protein
MPSAAEAEIFSPIKALRLGIFLQTGDSSKIAFLFYLF